MRHRSSLTVVVATVMIGSLALSSCANQRSRGNGSQASGTSTISARGTPGSSTSTAPQAMGGHYAGPAVAFDYPAGWHEFNLEVSQRSFAAYGPVSGGAYDFVAISPVPSDASGLPPEQLLALPAPIETGRMERVEVNAMKGYSISVRLTRAGQTLQGEETLVLGRQGEYLVNCQYGANMKALVPIGCQMLKDTLVEVAPPAIADPSGCTESELALLRSVPMPRGTDPGEMKVYRSGEGRTCDLMVLPSKPEAGMQEDLVVYFTSRLEAAGWRIDMAKVVESTPLQKWRVLAHRDWDYYMVEIYVDTQGSVVAKGAVQDFFITVVDG